jgi:hypothetical protein
VLAVCVSGGDISVAFDVVAIGAAWCKVVKAVVAPGIEFKYVIYCVCVWFAAVCAVWFVG